MPPRYQPLMLATGYGLLLALAATAVLLVVTRRPVAQPIRLQPPPTPRPVRVHVAGAVQRAGVYELAAGSIVQDAIDSAGGPTALADLSQINLARLLEDGDQVRVPELMPTGTGSTSGTGSATANPAPQASAKINLNTATAAELETLPRIGPTTAQRIVDYRNENGPFHTVEEIMEVSGIGPATYEAIKDLVTVE